MVVVLQLDQENSFDAAALRRPSLSPNAYSNPSTSQAWTDTVHVAARDASLASPRRAQHQLSALLACYPVAMSLAGNLDLNDLDALSRTSCQIRTRLLECRHQILPRTLHCTREEVNQEKARAGRRRWTVPCARDLVSPCRRCDQISCRNCIIKPPSNRELPRRYRRLCRACQKAELSLMTVLRPDPKSMSEGVIAGTDPIYGRGPCTCQKDGVYICKDCHSANSSDDINYIRVWTWRTRYHSLGFGLGTGIGEGNEGVKCGRGQHCLAARDIIVDMDCAEDGNGIGIVDEHGEEIFHVPDLGAALPTLDGESHREDAAGYYRQEIEGIGGVVKKKLKKRVRVGAPVVEHEDERETGGHLERERNGQARSWCAWCDRVIPSTKDEGGEHEARNT